MRRLRWTPVDAATAVDDVGVAWNFVEEPPADGENVPPGRAAAVPFHRRFPLPYQLAAAVLPDPAQDSLRGRAQKLFVTHSTPLQLVPGAAG